MTMVAGPLAAEASVPRTTTGAPTRPTQIPELDGLRGIAILLVFLTHFVALYLRGSDGFDAGVFGVARLGWAGVDLFFVLSGYLITGILIDTKGRPHYWRNYVAKRCLRIFPLYFGVLFVAFAVVPFLQWDEPQYATLRANQAWYWSYLVNFLLVFQGPGAAPLNTSHFWSLCIEEQFYLAWPIVVLLVSRRGLVQFALWAIGIGFLFRLAMIYGPGPRAAYVLTPGRLDGLMVGALLAVAARQAGGLAAWRVPATRVLLGAGAILVALGAWRGMEYDDPIIALVGYPLLAATFGAVLILALTTEGRWVGFLRAPALGQWGKYSYGLYVLHYPLLWALDSKLGALFEAPQLVVAGSQLPSVLLRMAVGIPLVYGLAWLSYHLYEKRFLALKRHFA